MSISLADVVYYGYIRNTCFMTLDSHQGLDSRIKEAPLQPMHWSFNLSGVLKKVTKSDQIW